MDRGQAWSPSRAEGQGDTPVAQREICRATGPQGHRHSVGEKHKLQQHSLLPGVTPHSLCELKNIRGRSYDIDVGVVRDDENLGVTGF